MFVSPIRRSNPHFSVFLQNRPGKKLVTCPLTTGRREYSVVFTTCKLFFPHLFIKINGVGLNLSLYYCMRHPNSKRTLSSLVSSRLVSSRLVSSRLVSHSHSTPPGDRVFCHIFSPLRLEIERTVRD